jgi:glutathione S-transferase
MYTLYYSPGTASMVVHLALLEIGVDYQLRNVNIEQGQQHSTDYLKLNPGAKVPTLLIDGRAVYESGALLIVLAERHPEAKLSPPPGTPEREEWLQWVVFLSNALMSTYRLWFYPQELGHQESPPDVRAAVQRKIEGIWERLEAQLSVKGPYLLGEQCSGADLMLTMLMRWSRNMPRPATDWPSLKRLADLVRARPSWKKLYELEGLSEW